MFFATGVRVWVEQVDCVILGDNTSTDNTETICREFAEKYPHIRYFDTKKFHNNRKNGNFN
jgi:hypothetical protein